MKILDVYILKKYLSTFIYLVFALCLIICVIDYSEKIDDYKDANLTLWEIITGYYAHMVPYLANFLSPLLIFISTILVTARLAGHTEITAILASGVSFNRILLTYFFGAALLALLTFYLIGWVIPQSNAKRIDFEIQRLGEGSAQDVQNIHLRVNDSTYLYLQHYNEASNTGHNFTLETLKDNDLTYRLKSNRVQWDSINKTWGCSFYSIRTYINKTEKLVKGDSILKLKIGVSPEDFQPRYNVHQMLTLPQLERFIERERVKGTGGLEVYWMEYYERFTYPFAIIILTLMGVIVSARKNRNGIANQLVIGFVLCFVYYAFLQLGRSFTQSDDLHPLMSAWIPNVVFIFTGLVLYKLVPK
jgi:lipopolysaccharide export system permease protein